jgi:hypothetical protein
MSAQRPTRRPGIADLLGYDSELLATLPSPLRADLDSLSHAWLVSCVLLGFPMGLALWLVEHSLVLSFLAAFGTSALVLNLLRLLTAGSGTAPDLPLLAGYRPSLTPQVMLVGLALIMSQPAQLLHASDEVRQAVANHRAELLSSHRAALSDVPEGSEDRFTKEIEACEFVVLRLSLLWKTPQTALLWTLLYVGLVLLPAALARTTYLKASRAYERARYRNAKGVILSMDNATTDAVAQALKAYPTYRPPWPFAPEPPLARRSQTPLRVQKDLP